MSDAWDVLRCAEEAVVRAEREGRTRGLERATSLLHETRSLFEQSKSKVAQGRALEAANSAISPLAIFAPIAIAIVVVIVLGYLAYRAIKMRRALRIRIRIFLSS